MGVDERQGKAASGPAVPPAEQPAPLEPGPRHPELAAKPPSSAPSFTEPAAPETLSSDRDTLEFDLAVGVIYHRSREAWFRGLHRGVLFLTTVLGAGTVATVIPPSITGVAIAALGAFDLASNLSGEAYRHAEFRQRYLGLVRKLVQDEFAPARLKRTRKALLKLSAETPPPYLAVEDVAHNQAIISLGRDPAGIEPVAGVRYWSRHIWRWERRG